MFQDAVLTLSQMGLRPADVKVLMACMSKKEGHFIAGLCAVTRIQRSMIYLSLKSLSDACYVTKAKVGGSWKYYGESPDSLISKQEMLLEALKGLAPFLKRLTINDSKMAIRFFEGSD